MARRFRRPIPLRWKDLDSVGVLNNAVHLTLVEQARFEYFQELGLLEEGQFPFVLARCTIDFRRPGRSGMSLEVEARTVRLGRSSFDMDFAVLGDGEVLSEHVATLVYVDSALASREIPPVARRTIAEYEGIAER